MFKDRFEAGKKLAQKLKEEFPSLTAESTLVLAIPRGGVAVGWAISRALSLPLDCLIIKRIRSPESEELAIGAVGEGGLVVWDEELCARLKITPEYQKKAVKQKLLEFEKKENDFRGDKPLPAIAGKRVFLVDDGVATGSTLKAAIETVRSFKPKEVIVAVPVIAPDSLPEIKGEVDGVIYLETPEMFFSVDQFYENFEQFSDEKVREMLRSI
jgi:predicted phosphoribosyltransferase